MGTNLEVRTLLERWVRGGTTQQRVARRARIVLCAMDGLTPDEIAARVGVSRATVTLWIERFKREGPEVLLHDAAGRGRHPSLNPSTLRDSLERAHLLNDDGTPVSLRRAAAALNVSPSALWRALHKGSGRLRLHR
jgi:putative transposase